MLQKSTTEKIAKVFFNEPERKFNLKDISRIVGIAHTSVKNELNLLIKGGLIKKENERKGKRNFPIYSAILAEQFILAKRISNEEGLINSGIIEFLVKNFVPNSIILFGSYSRGEDLKESDIDLFVESEFKEVNLKKYEIKLKRRINLLFKEDINKFKKETINNLVNGIVLYGAIELK